MLSMLCIGVMVSNNERKVFSYLTIILKPWMCLEKCACNHLYLRQWKQVKGTTKKILPN